MSTTNTTSEVIDYEQNTDNQHNVVPDNEIIEQLLQLNIASKDEIIAAMDSVVDKNNINEIVNYIMEQQTNEPLLSLNEMNSSSRTWQCRNCTFIQPKLNNICELCGCGQKQNNSIHMKINDAQIKCIHCTFVQSVSNKYCELCKLPVNVANDSIENKPDDNNKLDEKKNDDQKRVPVGKMSTDTYSQHLATELISLLEPVVSSQLEEWKSVHVDNQFWTCLNCKIVQSISNNLCEFCRSSKISSHKLETQCDNPKQCKHRIMFPEKWKNRDPGDNCSYCETEELFEMIDASFDIDTDEYTATNRKANTKVNCVPIDTCLPLQRIGDVLKYYDKWKQQKTLTQTLSNNNAIYQFISDTFRNGEYSVVILVDDFQHLLFKHDDQFEDIYNYLINEKVLSNKCNKDRCQILQRNYRNRFECSMNDKICVMLFNGNNNIEERVIHQVIDKIHCYYLHSFDCGYRLQRDQIQLCHKIQSNCLETG
eukprot:40798_1